ncbi:MAG TPA: 50S ribosomal protein L23 [Chloroflexi bacterium]|nr:50S ribosomal protein L23 [Chloroflexota bacterium]
MNPYEIIVRPIDTEKTRYQASELGQYTFEVHSGANKIEVKRAIEKIYGVQVASVNTIVMPAKISRRHGRRRVMRRRVWKKALVTLAPGQRMEVFEGV